MRDFSRTFAIFSATHYWQLQAGRWAEKSPQRRLGQMSTANPNHAWTFVSSGIYMSCSFLRKCFSVIIESADAGVVVVRVDRS